MNPVVFLQCGILCYCKHRRSGLSNYQPYFCFPGFQVNITAESTFAEQEPLELHCLVQGNGSNQQLQGVWFFNGTQIAHMDADGVLGLSKDYEKRASQGQLQVSKLNHKAFSLKIFSVGREDEGAYSCTVSEVVRNQTGFWQELQRKQSAVNHVYLKKPAGG